MFLSAHIIWNPFLLDHHPNHNSIFLVCQIRSSKFQAELNITQLSENSEESFIHMGEAVNHVLKCRIRNLNSLSIELSSPLTCTCMMRHATDVMTANCTKKHTAAGEKKLPNPSGLTNPCSSAMVGLIFVCCLCCSSVGTNQNHI
jgi:hypothetical protein